MSNMNNKTSATGNRMSNTGSATGNRMSSTGSATGNRMSNTGSTTGNRMSNTGSTASNRKSSTGSATRNNISSNTRRITTMAIMAALSVVLVFIIHLPVFPQAPFLEYDPADIPILIAAFTYGPVAGLLVTVAAAVVQGITVSAQSGFYGILMHFISTGSFVLIAGIIYRMKRSQLGAGIALVFGVLVSATVMVAANLVITPIFMGATVEQIMSMLLPVIIPFNLIKSGINAALTMMLYKPFRFVLDKAHLQPASGKSYNKPSKSNVAILVVTALVFIAGMLLILSIRGLTFREIIYRLIYRE